MTVPEERPGRGLWALGFVMASLVALVVVPAYLGRRSAEVQGRISEVLEEAGSLSGRMSLLKARQMARVEGFLLTGDRSFLEPYNASRAEEADLFGRLSDLTRRIDLEIWERLALLQAESTSWHLANRALFDAGPSPGALDETRREYEDLQFRIQALNAAIQSEVEQGRGAMARARELQTRINFGLGLLALGATVVVGRVGWRLRDLHAEADRRRQEAVRARREIDALLEATGDGVLGVDLDGRCTSLNRAGVELLGYTEREMIGRDLHDTLFHSWPDGSPRPREESAVLEALSAGTPLDSGDDAVLWRRRRKAFPARWSLRPMVDGTERRGGVLTFTDMTEIHEKEEALHRAISQREDVVSIVSHDLRNPLGVAMAAADLLIDLPLGEEERKRQAEVILRSGKRMQRLIEDLLDVAKIDAGAFVVRPSLEALEPILEEARSAWAHAAERRSVSLCVATAGGLPRVRIDRDRMLQALANLLDNAIRHAPEGGRVVLEARERPGWIDLRVSDDGPGIEPDVQGRLFDRFSQSAAGTTGRAGLGLAIVKGVAEAHHGAVGVDSRPGEGAVFTISLPRD